MDIQSTSNSFSLRHCIYRRFALSNNTEERFERTFYARLIWVLQMPVKYKRSLLLFKLAFALFTIMSCMKISHAKGRICLRFRMNVDLFPKLTISICFMEILVTKVSKMNQEKIQERCKTLTLDAIETLYVKVDLTKICIR